MCIRDRLYLVAVSLVSKQVGEFMQKRNKECILIQVAIYADAMIFSVKRMPVITQYGFSLPGNC